MFEEKIDYWHNPILPDMELSHARFQHFEFDQHVHLDYHIGVVTQGGQQYNHKGEKYLLNKDFISTLNPDESHNGQSINDEAYQAFVMSVPVDYANQIANELNIKEHFFAKPLNHDPDIYNHFLKLHNMLTQAQTPNSHLQIETTLMAFCTELFMRYGTSNLSNTSPSLSQENLLNIKARFHDEMGNSFQLEQLASSIGLSKFQFLRQFKTTTGMTPHAYLKRVRLEYAKKALAKGYNMVDIAHKVGFFDQSHFNKAFKNAFLITPSHFQKQIK